MNSIVYFLILQLVWPTVTVALMALHVADVLMNFGQHLTKSVQVKDVVIYHITYTTCVWTPISRVEQLITLDVCKLSLSSSILLFVVCSVPNCNICDEDETECAECKTGFVLASPTQCEGERYKIIGLAALQTEIFLVR